MIDKDNYCKNCKRSVYGEYKDCDINIENNGKYVRGDYECGCKVPFDKRTIYRQDAVEALRNAESLVRDFGYYKAIETIRLLPPAEPVKTYTKADYIMALHKEYGCTFTMAEEAHNKALEYLRSKARMKG